MGIETYPVKGEPLLVTCVRLTRRPDLGLRIGRTLLQNFSEIRVMSEPLSKISGKGLVPSLIA